MSRLRWKKQPPERGLRAVVAAPRGYELTDGTKHYATVSALSVGFHRYSDWYWVARNDERGVPLRNTCHEPVATVEQAKADAMAYVKQHLKGSAT